MKNVERILKNTVQYKMPKDSCQKAFAKGWLIDLFAKGKTRIFPVVSAQQGNLEAGVLW